MCLNAILLIAEIQTGQYLMFFYRDGRILVIETRFLPFSVVKTEYDYVINILYFMTIQKSM